MYQREKQCQNCISFCKLPVVSIRGVMSSNTVEIPMAQLNITIRIYFGGQCLVQYHQYVSMEVKARNPLKNRCFYDVSMISKIIPLILREMPLSTNIEYK